MHLYELTGYRNLPGLDKFLNINYQVRDNLEILGQELEKAGFRIFGNGSFGLAFQPPGREYVAKVWIHDPAYDYAINIIKSNQSNKHLPRLIWGPRSFSPTHKIVVMEYLKPVRLERWQATCLWEMEDSFNSGRSNSFGDVWREIEKSLSRWVDNDQLLEIVQWSSDIYDTIKLFEGSSFFYDLHQGNFMQRPISGDLILIDPLMPMT